MNTLTEFADVAAIVLIIFGGLFFLIMITLSLLGVPFVPTRRKKLTKMIELAELNENDIVYDLGSGDGRFITEAARKGVQKAVGFELNPFLNFYAWIRSKILRVKNVEFHTRNFWDADLSKCTKLFVYLLSSTMAQLEKKLNEEAQDGLIIISNTFKFKNLEPIQVLEKEKIYVYKIVKDSN